MTRMFSTLFTASAIAVAALAATPASAALVLNADGSLTASGAAGGVAVVNFDGFGGDPAAVIPGLTSSITFTFNGSSFNAGTNRSTFNFSYDVLNSASAPITDSRISLFGFSTNPDLTGATSTGVFDFADISGGNVPNHGVVEICFRTQPGGSCAGGGGGGVDQGDNGIGTFALTVAGLQSSITLDDLVLRYQGISGAGNVGSAIGRPNVVPEPGTWAMMLLGFGATGFALRRSRRKESDLLQIA